MVSSLPWHGAMSPCRLHFSQQDILHSPPSKSEGEYIPRCSRARSTAQGRGAHSSPQPCLVPHMAFTLSSNAPHHPFWSPSGDKQGPGKMCSQVAVGE